MAAKSVVHKKSAASNDEYLVRLQKLEQLHVDGVDPYPAHWPVSHTLQEATALAEGAKDLRLAGRLMSIRRMGKLSFAHLRDATAQLQVAIRSEELSAGQGKLWNNFVDVGDFIGVGGALFRTKTGELTLQVSNLTLLSKTLRPLPEKWHGLKDLELRLRKRYLDLIANPQQRELFVKRAKLIAACRQYLDRSGYVEVETPVLELIPGGADAKPFVTHHETLDLDLYLRISLELHLKRLVVGGFDRVYEIGKVFRNEGMSPQHLQEFTMLEFYAAYEDAESFMKFCEDFYATVIKSTFGTLQVPWEATTLNFQPPWPRLDYRTAIKDAAGVDILTASEDELRVVLRKLRAEDASGLGRGRLIDLLFKKAVRPKLIQPTFLINHPVIISPLAKRRSDEPELTERFQVLAAGSEIGNAFSELNNPVDQRERFRAQAALREAGDEEAQMMDEDFIEALEHGMPPTAGFGVGIDRLLMLLTNQSSIREVVLFPTMRPESSV